MENVDVSKLLMRPSGTACAMHATNLTETLKEAAFDGAVKISKAAIGCLQRTVTLFFQNCPTASYSFYSIFPDLSLVLISSPSRL